MTGDDLRRAAAAARQVFAGAAPTAAVPIMGSDVAGVAWHLVTVLIWYAQDLAAGPEETGAFELAPRTDAGLPVLLRQLDAAATVLARLFPWVPADGDPATTLRWATGRAALPGHEPVTSWRWHCAPLDEWDGAVAR